MKRWGVVLVLAALFVAGAVLSLLQLRPETDPLPDVELTDPSGTHHRVDEFERRVWVAAFSTGVLSTDQRTGLEHLVDAISGTPVVLLTPPDVTGPGDVPRGVSARAVKASPAGGFADGYASGFGLDRALLDHLTDGAVVLVSIDRSGAPRARQTLAPDVESDESPIVADVRFLNRLAKRPRLHAMLNGTSAVLLTLGWLFIRKKKVVPHLACMVSAGFVTSGFLISYLYYHYHAGSVSYPGTGWTRPVYFGVLLSHTVLAAFVPPLAVGTFVLAGLRRFSLHRGLARWTLPIWLYVSVTGVVIYRMLYS